MELIHILRENQRRETPIKESFLISQYENYRNQYLTFYTTNPKGFKSELADHYAYKKTLQWLYR